MGWVASTAMSAVKPDKNNKKISPKTIKAKKSDDDEICFIALLKF